ncbi:MAG: sulfite exporter TauE/SafE family protein [Betaproteobacteria bacterium]|nr:sulfite exporter TauE/SafE family protein [Betaproteobacteria bacterium]
MPEGLAVAAALLGFASGAHCLGMCGGIVGAFGAQRPVRITMRRRNRLEWRAPLAFNAGRISSYAAAGAVAGALGGGAGAVFGFWFNWQLALQIAASLLLILAGVQLAGLAAPLTRLESLGRPVWRHFQPLAARFVPFDTSGRAFAAGVAWGWLPCGMVYTALATALLAGGAMAGASVMLGFGLGTLPWLLAAGVGYARWRDALARPGWRIASGSLVLAFGVFGLARVAASSDAIRSGLLCL